LQTIKERKSPDAEKGRQPRDSEREDYMARGAARRCEARAGHALENSCTDNGGRVISGSKSESHGRGGGETCRREIVKRNGMLPARFYSVDISRPAEQQEWPPAPKRVRFVSLAKLLIRLLNESRADSTIEASSAIRYLQGIAWASIQ
jgi:hypothetical protein